MRLKPDNSRGPFPHRAAYGPSSLSGQSEEASLFSLVSIVALVCNFIGILLLVRQGVPHRLLADSLVREHDTADASPSGNDSDRRKMLSFAGLVLFALGTAMQLASIVFKLA